MSNLSFAVDIAPLFTSGQVGCMRGLDVDLDDYRYMGNPDGDAIFIDFANARHVYARLDGSELPRMPRGGPFWSEDMLSIFNEWMSEGFKP